MKKNNQNQKKKTIIQMDSQQNDIKLVGEYTLILKEKLGSGNFGNVYYGFKKQNPEIPLAIKVIRIQNIELLSKSIEREIKILQTLENKNIVKFYDIIRSSNNIYMVYEYCDGGDLDKLRNSTSAGYLSEAQTIVFMKHIVNGLKDLFQRKIIHRDLKPANILLHEGYCKIGDFGCSKQFEIKDHLLMTQNIGSTKYMAPEIYKSRTYDQKCDVWSFGIMVFELLYGKTPWTGKKEYDLFENHILKEKLEFPKIPKRSLKMKKFIQKMLVVDPKERMGLDDVCAMVFSFEEDERELIQKEEELFKITTKLVKRNRKKPVIGELYNDDLNEDFGKKIECFEVLEQKDEGGKELEKTNDQLKDTKMENQIKFILAKKKLKSEINFFSKNYKDDIFFFRNLAIFFGNCSNLLNIIEAKKQLDIEENLFFKIYYMFNQNENEYLKKSRKILYELEKLNLLSVIELNGIKKEIFSNEEIEFPINMGKIADIKVCLRNFLKIYVFDMFFEFEEVLYSDDYDQNFFKFVKFCCLIVKIKNMEEIIVEMKNEKVEQQFYKFYDKYDHMEKKDFIDDIKVMLNELEL